MDEKRSSPRYPADLAVEIDAGDGKVEAKAKDISAGGVGLVFDRALEERVLLALSLYLVEEGHPDETSDVLQLKGELVWTGQGEDGEYRGGVRFAPISEDHPQAEKLKQILSRFEGEDPVK